MKKLDDENLEDKMIQIDYYKGLENNFSDWNNKENENLFINKVIYNK